MAAAVLAAQPPAVTTASLQPRPVGPPLQQEAPVPKRENRLMSSGWKDVHLKIFNSDDSVTLPLMVSSTVQDVKYMLAEMLGVTDPTVIEFVYKAGPSYKRHRNHEQINTNLLVKGIRSFDKVAFEWDHPYCIIGAGMMGLRQAIQYQRQKISYVHFERMPVIGGNAWVGIANRTSKLQTEGPHYQLQYEPTDKGVTALHPLTKYGIWPTRDEILEHMRETAETFGCTAHLRLNTEVININIIKTPPSTTKAPDIRDKYYELTWRNRANPDEPEEGKFLCSCICQFPGCLVVPYRKNWPGEEVFEGQIGYGFSEEFDYTLVKGEQVIIVGMGAFAHENVRTCVEFGAGKVLNVVRRFNLMLPRVICWWVNQSGHCMPTAAMVLDGMAPMYNLLGWDPWAWDAVSANEDRTVAAIKQYTRWGVSDVYFLAVYFGKVEVLLTEIKRFVKRGAALMNGQMLRDIDHFIKVIGFAGDFGVDKLHKSKCHIGPWPDGDYRRCIISDQSAIDASRFGNIALSPANAMYANMTLWYHQHPQDCVRALESGLMPTNKSEPELGSPAYHYAPRVGTAWVMVLVACSPEIQAYQMLNAQFKQDSMLHLADAEVFVKACEEDWFNYCRMFKEQGVDKEWPEYPMPVSWAKGLQEKLADLGRREAEEKAAKAAAAGHGGSASSTAAPGGSRGGVEPGTPLSLEPAKAVLKARLERNPYLKDGDPDERRRAWLAEGHELVRRLTGAPARPGAAPPRPALSPPGRA